MAKRADTASSTKPRPTRFGRSPLGYLGIGVIDPFVPLAAEPTHLAFVRKEWGKAHRAATRAKGKAERLMALTTALELAVFLISDAAGFAWDAATQPQQSDRALAYADAIHRSSVATYALAYLVQQATADLYGVPVKESPHDDPVIAQLHREGLLG